MGFGALDQVSGSLFQVSPLAIALTSTRDNRYIDVNRTFEEVTGWTRDDVIGRTPADIGLWVDPEQRAHMVERLLTGETVRDLNFTIRARNGDLRSGLGWARLVQVDGEPCVFSWALDTTDSERALTLLREREEHFRLIANTVPVTIWSTGPDTGCTYVNQLWLDFTGCPLEAMLGFGWTDCLHPDDVAPASTAYLSAFDRREPFQTEYRLRRHDGEYRWFFATGVPRHDPDGTFSGYIGSATDISERKRLEEAISALSRRLIGAHEEQRAGLGRTLQDDISQRLAMVAVHLHAIKKSLPPVASEVAGVAIESLSGLVKDLQDLSEDLHSPRLQFLGLAAAAAGLSRDLSQRHRVEIECHAESMPSIVPPQVGLSVFRVLQEALENAIRHSGARQIEVRLKGEATHIELAVHDSGSGFDGSNAFKGHGLGLHCMRERLTLVGGTLSIDAHANAGTTIRALVPLPPSD